MHSFRVRHPEVLGLCVMMLTIVGVAGCGGSSSSPTTPTSSTGSTAAPTAGLTDSFSSIQSLIFARRCTTCHGAARREANLDLQTGAHGNLVNRGSQQASTNLVAPGNPDSSYLVSKLEGRSTSGSRMPQGGPFLAAEDVTIIRRWIQNGAPNN